MAGSKISSISERCRSGFQPEADPPIGGNWQREKVK